MAEVSISVRPQQSAIAGFSAGLALADISLVQPTDLGLGRRVKSGVIVPFHGRGAPARVDLDVGRYVVSVSMPTGQHLVQELVVFDEMPVSVVLGDQTSSARASSTKMVIRIESVRRLSETEVNRPVLSQLGLKEGMLGTTNDTHLQQSILKDAVSSTRAIADRIGPNKPLSLLSVGRRKVARQAIAKLSPQLPPARREAPRLVDLWSRREEWRSPLVADGSSPSLDNWLMWLSRAAARVPSLEANVLAKAESKDALRVDLRHFDRPELEANFAGDLSNVRPTRRLSQRYVCSVLPGGDVSSLAVAPWKWDSPKGPSQCVVGAFQERQADTGDWRMRVEVQDGEMSSVLAYLTRGDLGSAQLLLRSSLRMLMTKVKNPYAAAAGGYVLIYSKSEDIDAPDWPSWIRNLATWYPSSSDAQILMATLFLQRRRLLSQISLPAVEDDTQRLRYAGVLIARALWAGLPMYSMGMRLLLENLEILNEEEKVTGLRYGPNGLCLSETIRHVRAVSSCMKTVQPMTVLDFSDVSTSTSVDR